MSDGHRQTAGFINLDISSGSGSESIKWSIKQKPPAAGTGGFYKSIILDLT
jgi:hypothetical protein